jgi:hypothetical protein
MLKIGMTHLFEILKMRFFSLIVLLSCLLPSFLAAQGRDIKNTTYSSLKADLATKRLAGFNLKGKVKDVIDINHPKRDTSAIHHFSERGVLESVEFFNKTFAQPFAIIKERYFYRPDGMLEKIVISHQDEGCETTHLFNKQGYLEKVALECKGGNQPHSYTEIYRYDKGGEAVQVTYEYDESKQHWSLPRQRTYQFVFDERGNVIIERRMTDVGEYKAGSVITFTYHDSFNLPVNISFRDDCFGSNSCLGLTSFISYDKHGRLIAETLIDNTIRNSLWSYSYSYKARYNEQGDIIAIYLKGDEYTVNPMVVLPLNMKKKPPKKLSPMFQYEYDAQGNWIKQWNVQGELLLKGERRITYFY